MSISTKNAGIASVKAHTIALCASNMSSLAQSGMMMKEKLTALARKLAAHHKWVWLPGMQIVCDGAVSQQHRIYRARLIRQIDATHSAVSTPSHCIYLPHNELAYPDLFDPATVGALIVHWLKYCAEIEGYDNNFMVYMCSRKEYGETIGEAVARALLASWES